MSDKIDDIVIPILRELQRDMAAMKRDISASKADIGIIKADMAAMNMRLIAVESHMAGFMSTSRYHEAEIDMLRGRLETLEDQPTT